VTSSIDLNVGQQASTPQRVIFATIDYKAIAGDDHLYNTGGDLDDTLSAALVGLTFRSIPMAGTNGSTARYAKVVPATGKIQLFSDVACAKETSAGTDVTGYTAIPVCVVGD